MLVRSLPLHPGHTVFTEQVFNLNEAQFLDFFSFYESRFGRCLITLHKVDLFFLAVTFLTVNLVYLIATRVFKVSTVEAV